MSKTHSNKPIFIIDCQLFQTGTYYRGMGRYSYKLLHYLFEKHKLFFDTYDVVFLFNKNLPLEKKRMENIKKIKKNAIFEYIDYPKLSWEETKAYITLYKITLDRFLKDNFGNRKISFLLLSNFESDVALSVFPNVPSNKLLLFYDLIPYLFPNIYLTPNRTVKKDYLYRLKNVFEANHIFAISETTKNDLTNFLNINPDRVTSINGALIDNDSLETVQGNYRFSKGRPFILFPTGDEYRKNNEKTVKAFLNFNKKQNNKFNIILTSTFREDMKEQLFKLSSDAEKHVIFTNNISDKELQWLYQNAELVVFPPLYEGLGLPILEAVQYSKKIVASDIRVFKEISETAFYYCNPHDIEDIEKTMSHAFKDTRFVKKQEYKKITQEYTWENTVNKFVNTLKDIGKEQEVIKYNIAIVGPSVEGYSAIARYIETIYPAISEIANVDIYFDKGLTQRSFRESFLPYITTYKPIQKLNDQIYKNYNIIIYNIGNSEFHIETLKKALILPGIIILHDIQLKGMLEFAKQNNLLPQERIHQEVLLEKTVNSDSQISYNTSIVNSSLGIIVHSEYAKNIITEKLLFNIPLRKIDLPVSSINKEIKLKEKKITIGLAGIIDKVKGMDIFIKLLNHVKDENVEFKVFGYDFSNTAHNAYSSLLEKDNCTFLTNLSDFEFQNELQSLDLLINVREHYSGETSLTCIEAFKYAVPVIVKDIGWYSEIADNAVFKVKQENDVLRIVDKIIKDKKILKSYKENSYNLAKNRHSTLQYKKHLTELIEDIMQNKAKNNPNKLISELIKQGAEDFGDIILQRIYLQDV